VLQQQTGILTKQELIMQSRIFSSAATRQIPLTLAVIGGALFFSAAFSFSQTPYYGATLDNQGVFMGGMGLAAINGQSYYTINLRPELALGKFGVGLDVTLRYDTQTGHIRNEDWDESYDYFRAIRYLRYGHKRRDKFYTRTGALDAARLGHGFIMNYYNNSLLYEERKIGLELDIDFGVGGFELMTSNLGRREIIGSRIYYRPLQLVTEAPIIRNFTIGATFVRDDDPDAFRSTDDGISEFGLDAELPIIQTQLTRLAIYGDLAKINDFGSGQAAGVEFELHGIAGVFDFGAQLERRFLGERFLPAYFGPFYELERYNRQDGVVSTKKSALDKLKKETRGTFGMLYGQVLNAMKILGTYERQDGRRNSGILHVEASIPDAVPQIAFRAMYDDKNIDTFKDAFEMDENSAARVGLGYKINPYLIFYVDYIYTFRFDETRQGYVVQKRFEPQLALAVTFPVGGGR
jgi:hypothetical protein